LKYGLHENIGYLYPIHRVYMGYAGGIYKVKNEDEDEE
jgi:hypothetical protein